MTSTLAAQPDIALAALFKATRAAFATDAVAIPNEFGWRTPTYNSKAIDGRVCWTPGDPQGEAGVIGPAVRPGRNPKPLATLVEQFTVYVYGANVSEKTEEIEQYNAARKLFDYWYRSAFNATYAIGDGGRIALLKLAWVIEKKERPHGACLRALMTIESAIFDAPMAFVPTAPSAELNTGLTKADGDVITTSDGEVDIAPDAGA